MWHSLYVSSLPQGKRLNDIFRRRFLVPYSEFIRLAEELISNELFSRWTKPDCTRNEPSDYRLLLLGSLRYIGRYLTFDELEEHAFVSAETHRVFFHAFIEHMSTIFYQNNLTIPAHNMNYSSMAKLFHQAGSSGSIGSSDSMRAGMQRCASWAKMNNKDFKLAIPYRKCNATATHCHQTMGTAHGHPRA